MLEFIVQHGKPSRPGHQRASSYPTPRSTCTALPNSASAVLGFTGICFRSLRNHRRAASFFPALQILTGLSRHSQRHAVSSYARLARSFFVCFSCCRYISTNSFAVVASSGPLSSRHRPVNRGKRMARPAPGRTAPQAHVWIGLTVISAPRTSRTVLGSNQTSGSSFASTRAGLPSRLTALNFSGREKRVSSSNPVVRLDDGLEGLPSLHIGPCGPIFIRTEEAIECKQGDGEFLRHPLDLRLAPAAATDFLEREELPRVRIDRDGLAFYDRRAVLDCGSQALHDLGKLNRDILEMTGEEIDSLCRYVGLHAQAVVLVLEGHLPHSLEDLLERLEPLREHRTDRAEEFQMDVPQSVDAFRREDPCNLAEDRADVVCALDPRPIRFRRERGGQRVDDRHVRDSKPHLTDDHSHDVLRFPRGRVAQ